MENSKIILGYWNLRGLTQPIRLLVKYLGVELTEKLYSFDNMDEWKKGDKLTLGLDFPNLPYLINGDVKMTESRAIIKYIAREFGQAQGVNPSTKEDIRTCDVLENVLIDLWYGLLYYLNCDLPPLKQWFEDNKKKEEYLNDFLGNKKFLLGDQISYVDFIMYEMMHHFETFQAGYWSKCDNLLKFRKRFEEIPAIAKYMASSDYIKGPCINPFAKIKI